MDASDEAVRFLDDKSVLVTGGTGSFGRLFVSTILRETKVRRVVVFSRDELKQYEMQNAHPGEPRLRFFLGDVRDPTRLHRAFAGVDVVVHAAALKQIVAAEYNPFEAVHTNIHGAENVINAAIDQKVERVVALGTDKASGPVNLYGATKLVSDKLFVAGNAYVGRHSTRLSVVRYGNVAGTRGSVIPFFRRCAGNGPIPITDVRMTRFFITLPQAVAWVIECLAGMRGGEIFVPKIPSMKITDLAEAIAPGAELEVVGIRPGEKLHEELISVSAARHTVDLGSHFVIEPEADWWRGGLDGTRPREGFSYASNTNDDWCGPEQLADLLAEVGEHEV